MTDERARSDTEVVTSQNPSSGPYGKGPMWLFAIAGTLAGLVAITIGIIDVTNGRPAGVKMILIATACLAVLAIGIPAAIHRNRM